jgi:type I restriction enzyme S subunit
LGMIPKDWEVKKIKYVSNIIMGQSPNSDDINQEGIGIPFLQGKAEFGYKNPKAINFCNKPKKMSRVNDILISVRAPVGDLNISDNVYCIGRGLASIGSNRSNKYLYYTLLTYKDVLKSIATGSTFEAITIEQLKML